MLADFLPALPFIALSFVLADAATSLRRKMRKRRRPPAHNGIKVIKIY